MSPKPFYEHIFEVYLKMVGDIIVDKKKRNRKNMASIVKTSKEVFTSVEFRDSARRRPEDFTRESKMSFVKLVLFMLNMVKSSTQTCLDRFFEIIGKAEVHVTQQSFSEARQKIRWQAFRELFIAIVDHIYTGFYETWHGYRVMAIDGSKIQIPDDNKLKAYFGTTGKGSTAATAQASALYDVLNNFIMDAQLEPISFGERELAMRHIDVLGEMPSFEKELILFDRGYASFDLIKTLIGRGINYVMRVKKKFNTDIDQLEKGDHRIVLSNKDGEEIEVRVIKFMLESGEEEMLVTDVFDKRMGIKAFKALYFLRWPIETKYNEIKNKLEVENFSGRTVEAIRQDFFITMYMSNVASVACWEAQDTVEEARKLKANKYYYHVNVSHAIGTLKDRLIMAIMEPNDTARIKKIEKILDLLIKHVIPKRPNRSKPRNPLPRKAKFRHNAKSNI